jgi:Tfp pilus assembly protein PilF
MDNLKFLLQTYYRPLSAMSELMDKGSWFLAAIFVFVVSAVFYFTVNQKLHEAYSVPVYEEYYSEQSRKLEMSEEQYEQMARDYQKAVREHQQVPIIGDRILYFFSFEPNGFYRPLISLACFYVPLSVLLITLFGGIGSFGTILQRDYGTLSTCAMTAWTAAHLPFALLGILLYKQNIDPQIYLGFWLASGLIFAILMIFAFRVVFGVSYAVAIFTAATSWLGFSVGMYVFKLVSPILFSPFILFYAYMYFGGTIKGEARGFGNSFRDRQNFKRNLQIATINPNDADSHVQLGIIYNQRRQTDKAFEHFTKAFEIDKNEPDANYELGKIARQRGELNKAIEYFSTVVAQNDKYTLSEIWREIGATYFAANMLAEARNALETFVERRPFDSEGLYHLGKILKIQGETGRANEMFEQAIESAKNAPTHRRQELRIWSKLAQKEI